MISWVRNCYTHIENSAEMSKKTGKELYNQSMPSYQRATCTPSLPAALLEITEIENQPRYLSVDKWIKK